MCPLKLFVSLWWLYAFLKYLMFGFPLFVSLHVCIVSVFFFLLIWNHHFLDLMIDTSFVSLHLICQLTLDTVFSFAVLIDAIARNGSTAAPEANHVPPPSGWRDEDIRSHETSNASGDERKSYTEDQRQGVLRCLATL